MEEAARAQARTNRRERWHRSEERVHSTTGCFGLQPFPVFKWRPQPGSWAGLGWGVSEGGSDEPEPRPSQGCTGPCLPKRDARLPRYILPTVSIQSQVPGWREPARRRSKPVCVMNHGSCGLFFCCSCQRLSTGKGLSSLLYFVTAVNLI